MVAPLAVSTEEGKVRPVGDNVLGRAVGLEKGTGGDAPGAGGTIVQEIGHGIRHGLRTITIRKCFGKRGLPGQIMGSEND